MTRWIALLALFTCGLFSLHAQQSSNRLANTTLLIIRHAEKPQSGTGLSPEGVKRADEYVHYFQPFRADGLSLSLNGLFSGADSKDSFRPRLTLEPLSHAKGIPLDLRFDTNAPEALAHVLSTEPHGDHLLIAWRHHKIPALLQALGADSSHLLPDNNWPDAVFDWVILLRYDADGHLQTQKLIHEPVPLTGR